MKFKLLLGPSWELGTYMFSFVRFCHFNNSRCCRFVNPLSFFMLLPFSKRSCRFPDIFFHIVQFVSLAQTLTGSLRNACTHTLERSGVCYMYYWIGFDVT